MGVDTVGVNGERNLTGESITLRVTRWNDNAHDYFAFRNAQIQELALLLRQRDQTRLSMGYTARTRHQSRGYQKPRLQANHTHIFQRKIVH
jgi:hypothetical protein